MDTIEKDYAADAAFLSLDFRRQVIDDKASIDDLAVLYGLVVAGRVSAGAVATVRRIADLVAEGVVSAEDWNRLHQLWYRWKVPLGAAPLSWWYLFCLALRRQADGDAKAAWDLLEDWVERIEGADLGERVAVYSALTGLSADRGVVAVLDDEVSLAGFVTAALQGLPLLGLWSEDERTSLAEAGVKLVPTVEAGGDSGGVLSRSARGLAGLRTLCLGRRPQLGGLSEDTRRFWADMTAEDRTYVLVHLEQKLACLEIVRVSYGNALIDNLGIAQVLSDCRKRPPSDWTPLQLRIAALAWTWQEAGFIIQELNQAEISLPTLRVFMERRVAEYERITGDTLPTGLHLMDLARQFAKLRMKVERTHQRCIYFDGGNWERREFIVTKAACHDAQVLPPSIVAFMRERFGVAMPTDAGSPAAIWKLYLGALLSDGQRPNAPTELMIALAEWAANTDDLPVDYAIFDVPMGIKLDRPWEMEIDEIFCYTATRAGFEPRQAGVPLNPIGIRNAIGQRMRYNAIKKAQNYALIKRTTPQSFLLPDISVAEDAHHGGHYASGIRHACRIPMAIHYDGSEWKGIADVRLSRADYADANRFREPELVIATRYGVWAKAIADETYARGLLFERSYCSNLDDGRDVAARLGRT